MTDRDTHKFKIRDAEIPERRPRQISKELITSHPGHVDKDTFSDRKSISDVAINELHKGQGVKIIDYKSGAVFAIGLYG